MIISMSLTEGTPDSSVASKQKVAKILMWISYALGAVGIYFGFSGGASNFGIFCLLAVGGPTVAGFIRHFFLWQGDAARLGFETRDPSWMWEVAFANLAIAVAAIVTVALNWGIKAQATVVLVMGVYMLGAALVHAMSWKNKSAEDRNSPIVHIAVPVVYAAILLGLAFTNV